MTVRAALTRYSSCGDLENPTSRPELQLEYEGSHVHWFITVLVRFQSLID